MGTYEDDDDDDNHNNHAWIPECLSKEPELGFTLSGSHTRISQSTLDVTEDALVQKFENAGLKSNENENEIEIVSDNHKDYGNLNGSRLHPLRPYAEDCPYYLRTGTCKFGLNCKFNHPVRRTNEVDKEKGKDKELLSEKLWQIECKYYLTAGGCKYGKSCRYNHSKEESESGPPELNFLGLPIRLGERECPFYMRNLSCGYGAQCRFHHPDPTTGGGSDLHNSTLNDVSVGQFGRSSGNCNDRSVPLHLSGVSHITQTCWSSSMTSDGSTVRYLDNHSSYMPATHLQPQGVHQNPEWSGYQAPNYPQERSRHPHSAPATNSYMKKPLVFTQIEEFPERPGQPECDYFMKTGDCKFKSACRYHHPKSGGAKTEVCVLSDKGLPLKPGKTICRHYEQYGICKYGSACLFDHPVNHGSNAGLFGGTRMAGCKDGSEATIQHSV